MALADFETLVDSMVPATDPLTEADRDAAIQLAVQRYSQDVPQELVRDVVWEVDGYLGPLPEDWATGADLSSAEYPIGEVPPAALEMSVYVESASSSLLMAAESVTAGESVRVTFTLPHQLVAGGSPMDTIPLKHREAVACYAAHVLCRQLATHYANERETSINADGSNTESRARNFGIRQKQYRADYYAGIGKADPQGAGSGKAVAGGSEAAGAVTSWPGRSRNSLTRGTW